MISNEEYKTIRDNAYELMEEISYSAFPVKIIEKTDNKESKNE